MWLTGKLDVCEGCSRTVQLVWKNGRGLQPYPQCANLLLFFSRALAFKFTIIVMPYCCSP